MSNRLFDDVKDFCKQKIKFGHDEWLMHRLWMINGGNDVTHARMRFSASASHPSMMSHSTDSTHAKSGQSVILNALVSVGIGEYSFTSASLVTRSQIFVEPITFR